MIHGVYYLGEDQFYHQLGQKSRRKPAHLPAEFIVAVTDRREENVYTQAPLFVEITFENGHQFHWDFRQKLTDEQRNFPGLWNVFKESIRASDHQTIRTQGNYGSNYFLIKLPTDPLAEGNFIIRAKNIAGNERIYD